MAPSDLDQLRQNIATWSGCQENVQRRRDLRASALAVAASLGTPEDIFADAFYQPVLAVGILVAMETQWLQCLSTNTAPLVGIDQTAEACLRLLSCFHRRIPRDLSI